MDPINPQNSNLSFLTELKRSAQIVANHFKEDRATYHDGIRIHDCAERLRTYPESGDDSRIHTWYCKHRSCPVCQWRKALRFCSNVHQMLDRYPSLLQGKWLYLTLTVRNCLPEELRSTLEGMIAAFNRLKRRDFWKQNVAGGIRFIEIGDGHTDSDFVHPHFHCLLLVSPSMYAGVNYVSEQRWREQWQEAMQVHYHPQVKVNRLLDYKSPIREQLICLTRYSMKPRAKPLDRLRLFTTTQELRGMRLVEPFGEVRALLSGLDDQITSNMQERKDCVQKDHEFNFKVWDSGSGQYRWT